MARNKAEGLCLRDGKTWYLDFRHNGERYVCRSGKNISKNAARELSTIKRSEIIKVVAGVKRKRNITLEKAAEEFLKWAEANRKPTMLESHKECVKELLKSFRHKRVS
jgi:hypothetical protein